VDSSFLGGELDHTAAGIGVWLIGARGSISSVTIAGHAALLKGSPALGLVTERAPFRAVDLPRLDQLVFGGHEIQGGTLRERARPVLDDCGLPGLADHLGAELDAVEARIRPGVVRGGGKQITALGEQHIEVATDAEAVEQIRKDLDAFRASTGVGRIVVINLASTEPRPPAHPSWADPDQLLAALAGPTSILPPSSLYACAALLGGDAYVNFTPSLGSRIPALEALALRTGALHGGSDGKTGETLVKSVLAELFARRNLPVLSWFGQNILGNGDGRVLDDPDNKATKVRSKDHLLPKMLGYAPESKVGIDYVGSLGEWKIAWDHIHFQGFLGGRMNMQFTWTGCDSLLAAPLVLDLVRLTAFAQARGEAGVLTALASFFKDPMGIDEQRLVAQDELLLRWLAG
jgi:myo-inositol-1-phosphate synthase